MMEVTIRDLSDLDLVREACEMTMHGQKSRVSLRAMYKAEHSPIRVRRFWIKIKSVETFVSVHLVRHKHGIEHFVQSMRDDLYIGPDFPVDRHTPVNHGFEINAQALITISRKRLCYKAHARTVAAWRKVRKAVETIDPELTRWMVPHCVACGYCPEMKVCRPGLQRVLGAYRDSGPAIERAKAALKGDISRNS